MIGGFGEQHAPTAEDQNRVNTHAAAIGAHINLAGVTFHVEAASTQVVAGTNHFFHLTGSDGHKYSTCIYEPLPHTGAPDQVTFTEAGWTAAHGQAN